MESTIVVFKKAFVMDGNWDKDTFEEFPEVVYWIRNAIGLITGLICGYYAVQGIIGFIAFAISIFGIPFIYYARYANVNVDDFGQTELLTVGVQAGFGLFLLSWIGAFSFYHSD